MGAISKQYYLHGVLLGGSTWIKEVEDATPAANIDVLTARGGSVAGPQFRGANSAVPDITFTTPDIKTVLDACSSGSHLYADYSESYVDLFFRRATNCGIRATLAAETGLYVRARRCILAWTRIQSQQDRPATIACRIIPTYDGTNSPMVGVGTTAITTGLTVTEQWTTGPVKLNGTDVEGVQGWTLENNLRFNVVKGDGEVWPRMVNIEDFDPILSIDTPDLDKWVTPIGDTGLAITALIAHLTKRNVNQIANVPDATSEHITFTAAENPAGMAYVENTRAGRGPAMASLVAALSSTYSSVYPLTINTADAIT